MKIAIKDFPITMELGSKGITMDIYSPDGTKHLGDIRLGKKTIEWCKGRTGAGNGKKKTWSELIAFFENDD